MHRIGMGYLIHTNLERSGLAGRRSEIQVCDQVRTEIWILILIRCWVADILTDHAPYMLSCG